MDEERGDVEATVLERLRAAGEPVREAILYERVRAVHADADEELFMAVLARLATHGQIGVMLEDPGLPADDPEPFEARFWHVVAG